MKILKFSYVIVFNNRILFSEWKLIVIFFKTFEFHVFKQIWSGFEIFKNNELYCIIFYNNFKNKVQIRLMIEFLYWNLIFKVFILIQQMNSLIDSDKMSLEFIKKLINRTYYYKHIFKKSIILILNVFLLLATQCNLLNYLVQSFKFIDLVIFKMLVKIVLIIGY